MFLNKLFKDITDIPDEKFNAIEIRKIQYDSRKIEKGDLFVAVKGFKSDGHTYLQQVQKMGAAAAVVQEIKPGLNLVQIPVKDTRKVMALLAYNYYRENLKKLSIIGITGTNGKTTCSYLIQSMLQTAGISCGLAGTIHYIIGTRKIDAWNTTPEAVDLYEMLSGMQQDGNKACVLEVSSHALALNRVSGLNFKAAVFTNLSRDHMDFHSDMEEYFSEKRKLFTQLSTDGCAVINMDDNYGKRLTVQAEKLTYGLNSSSDVYPAEWKMDSYGTQLNINTPLGEIKIYSALIGEYNVYNILASVATGLAMKLSLQNISKGIESLKSVPGRLEKYVLGNGALAVIDYAHSPDALQNALETLRKITRGKLICLFGCGGDRDKGKRPQMGETAQRLADVVFITDDNPRTESPQAIIDDILAAVKLNDQIHVVPDRREAIRQAVRFAGKDDVILIAGKGHENYQIIGTSKYNFNEAEIIRETDNA
jgi:UDP-N-acetylmuramoyl-L-alanyl-D-glutamate--2,6-diaminopimelate ligase